MNPMIPFITGSLCGSLLVKGQTYMKIVGVEPAEANSFQVTFSSGLVLCVTVTEIGANANSLEEKPIMSITG